MGFGNNNFLIYQIFPYVLHREGPFELSGVGHGLNFKGSKGSKGSRDFVGKARVSRGLVRRANWTA